MKEQVDEEKLGPLFELILNLDPDKSLDKPAEKGPLLKTGGESPSESFDIWSRLSQGRERTKQKELWTSPGFSYGQRQQQEQAQAKQISQVQAAKQRQRQEQLTLVPGSPNGYLISPFAEPGTDGRTIPAEQIPFQSLEFKYTWPQILQGLIEKNQEASPRKLAASLLQQQVNYQMRIGTLPPGHIDVTFVDDHNVKVRGRAAPYDPLLTRLVVGSVGGVHSFSDKRNDSSYAEDCTETSRQTQADQCIVCSIRYGRQVGRIHWRTCIGIPARTRHSGH